LYKINTISTIIAGQICLLIRKGTSIGNAILYEKKGDNSAPQVVLANTFKAVFNCFETVVPTGIYADKHEDWRVSGDIFPFHGIYFTFFNNQPW